MKKSLLLSLPILALALIAQSVVLSRITLLSGCADLVLLVVSAWALQERVPAAWPWALLAGLLTGGLSALPWFVPLIGYTLVALLARGLTRRLWQAPLLSMFLICLVGTFLTHTVSLVVLQLSGRPLPWREAVSLIMLPSALLNLVLAIPVYVFIHDLANWLYPAAEE